MNDTLMNLMFGIAIVGAIILIIGFISGRNLPEIEQKIYIRKFAAVALALIFFGLIVSNPFVSSYSNAKHIDELKAEKINSLEDVAEINKKQAYIISELTEDVKDLRADLYSVDRYYSIAITILIVTAGILISSFAFLKKEGAN